jgi:hypothetical protein
MRAFDFQQTRMVIHDEHEKNEDCSLLRRQNALYLLP